jgi:hypothetical protein
MFDDVADLEHAYSLAKAVVFAAVVSLLTVVVSWRLFGLQLAVTLLIAIRLRRLRVRRGHPAPPLAEVLRGKTLLLFVAQTSWLLIGVGMSMVFDVNWAGAPWALIGVTGYAVGVVALANAYLHVAQSHSQTRRAITS